MKSSIIFISILCCFSFTHPQNQDSKPARALYVVKSQSGTIKTNLIFVDAKDIENLYLPSKAEASESLGPVSEDVVIYMTLKKGVKVLSISKLLAYHNLDAQYNNIPVYIDGTAISDPDAMLATKTGLKNIIITRTSKRIDLSTKSGLKIENMDAQFRH
jgi:hypothetical protein